MTPTPTVVEAARACPLLTRARAVAAFVDAGRPVTAKAVLRRADIPAACAAAGLPDPGRVVSAAHVRARPRVGHRYAQAVTTAADAIDQWRHGVAAVLRAESDDPGRRGAAIVCTAALHEIIQILFEWDGDHLHVFTVDGMHYADPLNGLDGCADSDQLSLAAALPRPGARLAYRYDLGDCWDHTVLLETGTPAGAPHRPTCIDGRGDAPVEDWHDEEPPPPRPLDLVDLDRRLAHHVGRS